MTSNKDKWYDSDDPERFARGAGWFGLRWGTIFVIALLVVSAVIGAAYWAVGVGTSDIKGRGDQIKQNNSAVNRTEQQQHFEDLYASIKSLDQRIDLAAQKVTDDKANGQDTSIDATNLNGAQNVCLQAVGQYNADARKVLARDWRSPDLPQEINQNDPTTDCKPASGK